MGTTRQHLFLMDPFDKLNLKLDSSLRMAYSLSQRGEEIFFATPTMLSQKSAIPSAYCLTRRMSFSSSAETAALDEGSQVKLLKEFDCIHMRKDPPYDLNYLGTTWILDSASPECLILNSPSSLRSLNEKLAILLFPQYCTPTLVSHSAEEIFDFILQECESEAVLKPLTLFGGKGIEKISLKGNKKEREAMKLKILDCTRNGLELRMCQKFLPEVYRGEVRVFSTMGKPICWCLKVPQDGNFLANSNFGSRRKKYSPTRAEEAMIEEISSTLMKDYGVYLIGFDLIGGKLGEINITSPRLLVGEDDPYQDYYEDFSDLLLTAF